MSKSQPTRLAFLCLLIVLGSAHLATAQPGPPHATDPAAIAKSPATPSPVHGDPIAPVLLGIIVIILAARVGGHVFEAVGQPAVLGELMIGVIIGNLTLAGIDAFEFLKVDYTQHQTIVLHDYQYLAGVTIDHLSRIGVILLLFQVGLESSLGQMRRVGGSALIVAAIGVIVPVALGWGFGYLLLPDRVWAVHMFLGAALCATSVGITARVLQDLGQSQRRESRIVLGAAVIDDVLGLVVLALVSGVVQAMHEAATGGDGQFSLATIGFIVLKAMAFLVVALVLGQFISRPLFKIASYLRGRGLLIVSSLAFCFLFAWAADAAGLATIVGAFAAGLVLEDAHYQELMEDRREHDLETLLRPLADLLVPIFFVEMGMHVDLVSFIQPKILILAAGLSLIAVVGKLACSLGVIEKGLDRLSVGIGMIPRGEVGLIFAAIGLRLHIGGEQLLDQSTYSALVVMVIATTLVTPPLLKWSLHRHQPET